MSDIQVLIISIIGGLTAGIINTLAGNGSVITLGILTEVIGLPANVANGTNRLGVLLQSTTSFLGLKSNIDIKVKDHLHIISYTLIGAILGGITAAYIDNGSFQVVYKVMMVVMLFTILAKPDRWLKASPASSAQRPEWLTVVVFMILGFYGGFIQMGMGLLFLAVVVLFDGKAIMASNVLKSLIIMIFTAAVLGIFILKGLIDWKAGAALAIAQGVGGWIGGKYISKSEKANKIAYYTLLVMVIGVLIKMFLF